MKTIVITESDLIKLIENEINESFKSKAQARFFYAKANEKSAEGRKFKKYAKEFSDKTDFSDLPNKVTETKDELKGGKGDNKSLQDIAELHKVSITHLKNQLKIGIPTEMEHTKNINIAKEIVFDHLSENPNYYTILNKAGLVD